MVSSESLSGIMDAICSTSHINNQVGSFYFFGSKYQPLCFLITNRSADRRSKQSSEGTEIQYSELWSAIPAYAKTKKNEIKNLRHHRSNCCWKFSSTQYKLRKLKKFNVLPDKKAHLVTPTKGTVFIQIMLQCGG